MEKSLKDFIQLHLVFLKHSYLLPWATLECFSEVAKNKKITSSFFRWKKMYPPPHTHKRYVLCPKSFNEAGISLRAEPSYQRMPAPNSFY